MPRRYANLDDAVRERRAVQRSMTERYLGRERFVGLTPEQKQKLVADANRAWSPPGELIEVFRIPDEE